MNRSVDFIKVDAQGLDLQIIESAGSLLDRVKGFSIEVRTDGCGPLYTGQPECSKVVQRAAELGFVLAGDSAADAPPPCAPKFALNPRYRATAFACELEMLFVRPGTPVLDSLWQYHQLKLNGCDELYRNEDTAKLASTARRRGKVVLVHHGGGLGMRFYGTNRTAAQRALRWYRDRPWTREGATSASGARRYMCGESFFSSSRSLPPRAGPPGPASPR